MGIAPDLMEARADGRAGNDQWLGRERWEAVSAYVLCSLAGDLKVHGS
jgi:hypothetical protein